MDQLVMLITIIFHILNSKQILSSEHKNSRFFLDDAD